MLSLRLLFYLPLSKLDPITPAHQANWDLDKQRVQAFRLLSGSHPFSTTLYLMSQGPDENLARPRSLCSTLRSIHPTYQVENRFFRAGIWQESLPGLPSALAGIPPSLQPDFLA